MKKWIALRHYFMLLGCMVLFGLLIVLFDQRYPLHISFLISFLAMLLPTSIIARIMAHFESRHITNTLDAVDFSQPEQIPVEQELASLAQKIQEQNDVIAAQVSQIREESVNRESIRREFTANVSHELKTPLTTISGTAEILRSGMVKPEDVAHFADNIYRESQRMITLVSDILHLSELEETSTMIKLEPVNLYTLAQEVFEWLQPSAEHQQVTLHLEGCQRVISGNKKVLSDMILNLCDNGIKYSRPGGWVKVEIFEQDGQVSLTVSDNGIGIPKEHQDRVFERFYRVDKSHSREIGGTGLGLSIVKHGAIVHQAKVQLYSEENSGTRITLLFPNSGQNSGNKGSLSNV